jgi:hypothetical protein
MKLSLRHYGILLGGILAAYFHLVLYPDIMFTLNGLGYLGLLGAYFLPIPFFQQRHKMVWWALAGYALLTIILWVVMGEKQFAAGTSSAIGYYAKASEVFLLACLWADKPK